MAINNLGKIKHIDLRKAWSHEALDFTKWLAEEENLHLLSNEIGVGINLIRTEKGVGDFSSDILAEEENTGNKIIIENQLERTDHDHLGKIITYASGLDANMVIWIVKEAREEHRQAIDWLNEHTNENLSFFLIRIELWQIENSPLAPKFETISRPNDWAKEIKRSASEKNITPIKTKQLEFWGQFKAYTLDHNTTLSLSNPRHQHWLNANLGTSKAHIGLSLNSLQKKLGVEIWISNNKEVYYFLEEHKDEIEKELGYKLEWMELPGKKASRIMTHLPGSVNNTEEWGKYFQWLQKTAEQFQKTFIKYLR